MATTDEVQAYYQAILRAPGDTSGVNYWAGQIDAGAISLEAFGDALLGTAEAEEVRAVMRLYQGVFDRVADEGGMNFWLGHFRNFLADGQGDFKTDLVELIDLGNWLQSDEFLATYGNTTDEEFITLLYQNVLQRDPDQNGLDYWTNLLTSGATTRERMVVDFTESDEFKGNVDAEIDGILKTDAALDSPNDVDDSLVAYDLGSSPFVGELFNEAPTDITIGGNGTIDLRENQDPTFTFDGPLIVSDQDGFETFNWEIISDPTGWFELGNVGAFDQDASKYLETQNSGLYTLNGQVSVALKPTANLDYETATSHDITVRVTDGGGNIYDEVITINVVNDPSDDGGASAAMAWEMVA